MICGHGSDTLQNRHVLHGTGVLGMSFVIFLAFPPSAKDNRDDGLSFVMFLAFSHSHPFLPVHITIQAKVSSSYYS